MGGGGGRALSAGLANPFTVLSEGDTEGEEEGETRKAGEALKETETKYAELGRHRGTKNKKRSSGKEADGPVTEDGFEDTHTKTTTDAHEGPHVEQGGSRSGGEVVGSSKDQTTPGRASPEVSRYERHLLLCKLLGQKALLEGTGKKALKKRIQEQEKARKEGRGVSGEGEPRREAEKGTSSPERGKSGSKRSEGGSSPGNTGNTKGGGVDSTGNTLGGGPSNGGGVRKEKSREVLNANAVMAACEKSLVRRRKGWMWR